MISFAIIHLWDSGFAGTLSTFRTNKGAHFSALEGRFPYVPVDFNLGRQSKVLGFDLILILPTRKMRGSYIT